MSFMKIKLSLKSTIKFGKYKGNTVEQLMPLLDDHNDYEFKSDDGNGCGLSYFEWIKRDCPNIELAQDILDRMVKLKNIRLDLQLEKRANDKKQEKEIGEKNFAY